MNQRNIFTARILLPVALFVLVSGCYRYPSPDGQLEPGERRAGNSQEAPTQINPGSNRLDLSGQNLTQVPSYVFTVTNLEELIMTNNRLTGALPAEIRQLQNLKKLDVSGNLMTGIPAEIGQLSKLEELNYANNNITGLPNELANLKNLKILNLTGSDFSRQDLEAITKNLPNLKVIY